MIGFIGVFFHNHIWKNKTVLTRSFHFFDIRYFEQYIITKIVEIYLPNIASKPTDLETTQHHFSYFQMFDRDGGMPFVNIFLDVGLAMNALRKVWNYPYESKNNIIDLGSFHFIKKNFQVSLSFEWSEVASERYFFKHNKLIFPYYTILAFYNPLRNISGKTKKSSKARQGRKSLIYVFA